MMAVLAVGGSLIVLAGVVLRWAPPKPPEEADDGPTPAMKDAIAMHGRLTRRVAFSVPTEPDLDGRWSLMKTDASGVREYAGAHYPRRSTALRACRRANAREAVKFRPSGPV